MFQLLYVLCVCVWLCVLYLGWSSVERVPAGLMRWIARFPLRLYDSVSRAWTCSNEVTWLSVPMQASTLMLIDKWLPIFLSNVRNDTWRRCSVMVLRLCVCWLRSLTALSWALDKLPPIRQEHEWHFAPGQSLWKVNSLLLEQDDCLATCSTSVLCGNKAPTSFYRLHPPFHKSA